MPSHWPVTEDLPLHWRARPGLGTLVQIGIATREPERAEPALDAAFTAIARIEALMSYHSATSDLTRLNTHAAEAPQRIDPLTWAVLEAAVGMAEISAGAFDPCIAPHLERTGHLPRHDPHGAAAGSWRDIELGCGTVRFTRPLRLDLGGIAKGFAVDRACEALEAHGIERFLVNAGGDLRARGQHAVWIRDPHTPLAAGHRIRIAGEALATSAAYFSRRTHEGREVSALIDPARGAPLIAPVSVSVRAARALWADALTKVVLFAPAEHAERVLAAYGARAIGLGERRVA